MDTFLYTMVGYTIRILKANTYAQNQQTRILFETFGKEPKTENEVAPPSHGNIRINSLRK